MSFKRSAASNITRLNPKELANTLINNGYGDLSDVIIDKNLDGHELVNMGEIQARILRLDKNLLKRLLQCIESLKHEPEKFVIKQSSDRKHGPFPTSSQNTAARAKIEKLFANPRQSSVQNFATLPLPKQRQKDEEDHADNEYLCMDKKNYRPESPLYDDQGYLTPAAINDSSQKTQFKSLTDRKQQTPNSSGEEEEEYENIPKVSKPKLPPRVTKTTPWKESVKYVNHPSQTNRNHNASLNDANSFKLPPITPRGNTFENNGKSQNQSPITEKENRIVSWMRDKQHILGKINTKFTTDKTNSITREHVSNDTDEENIYEQEPSTPPQRKQNLKVTRPTSLSFSNRPLPRIPTFGDQNSSSPTSSTTKRTPDVLQLPEIRSLKGSKESIITDSEDENMYKNDSIALEHVRRNLLSQKTVLRKPEICVQSGPPPLYRSILGDNYSTFLLVNKPQSLTIPISYEYKFNEDVPKPPPLTKKDNATAKTRNWKTSNTKLTSRDTSQYGNLGVNEIKDNDNESGHSTTSSTLSLSNISNSANSPSTGKFKRVDLEPADDNDEDYASAVFNLNDEPFFRNTDRIGARELLDGLEDGGFLFRPTKRNYFLTLTVKWRKKFFNINIVKESNSIRCQSDSDIDSPSFSSLTAFVRHFERHPLTLKYDNDISEVYLRSVLPAHRY